MKDKEVTLNYIDKLHNSLQLVGKILHSFIKWNFFVCIILIFISIGEIKFIQKSTFFGFEFEFSIKLLMIVLSCLISWMLAQITGLLNQETEIRDSILRLYSEISFEDSSMSDKEANPLEYPSYWTIPFREKIYGKSKTSSIYLILVGLIGILLIFIFPLIVQILVFINLIDVIGAKWWLISIFSILMIISTVSIIGFIRTGEKR
jgi:hypothetical protein